MKSTVQKSLLLFLAALLLAVPAESFAVTFLIGSNDIMTDAVLTPHIAPFAVTNDKIATGAITQDKLAFTLPGSAGYANVIVVAQSGGDFTSPIDAVNSVTGTPENRYLVKIMPGVYDLGDQGLNMKAYVDLEGSGSGNTLITSANSNVSGNTCAAGTVVMTGETSIRSIKIENRAPNLGGNAFVVAALAFPDGEAKAENVAVLTGSETGPGGRNIGICTEGDSTHAILNNLTIKVQNYQGDAEAIAHMGGKITLTNSNVQVSHGNGDSVHIINNHGTPEELGNVTIINSILEGYSSGTVYGMQADHQFEAHVSNSKIALHGTANLPFNGFWPGLFVHNTELTTDGPISYGLVGTGEVIRIATSLLPGDLAGLNGAKLVHCYNEYYDPIPNTNPPQ